MGIILLEDSGQRMELSIYSCVNEGLYSNSEWLKAVKHSLCSKKIKQISSWSIEESEQSILQKHNKKCHQKEVTWSSQFIKCCKHMLKPTPIQDSTWVHA